MIKVKRNDWLSLIIAIAISLTGILSIISSEGGLAEGLPYLAKKQLTFLGLALFSYIIFSFINYRWYAKIAPVLYFLGVFLLLMVLLVGVVKGGSKRWLLIGAIQFQPSELVKIFIVIILARIFTRLKDEVPDKANFAFAFLSVIPVILLITAEPDLGTALVYFLIFLVMSFVSPVDWRLPITFILVCVLLIPTGWPLLKNYQKARIISFVNPSSDPLGKGYQSNQSKIAIGSGGFKGWGLFKGPQNKLDFIPSQTTDFIFTIIGEEGGFLFSSLVVIAYLVLILRIGTIGARAPDEFGSLILFGICSMFFIQSVVNIGMTIGIMPVAGLPLPLMSYGGSSLIINFISLGIANSVYKYSKIKPPKRRPEIKNILFRRR